MIRSPHRCELPIILTFSLVGVPSVSDYHGSPPGQGPPIGGSPEPTSSLGSDFISYTFIEGFSYFFLLIFFVITWVLHLLLNHEQFPVLHIDALLRLTRDAATGEVVDRSVVLDDHSLWKINVRRIVIAKAIETTCA